MKGRGLLKVVSFPSKGAPVLLRMISGIAVVMLRFENATLLRIFH